MMLPTPISQRILGDFFGFWLYPMSFIFEFHRVRLFQWSLPHIFLDMLVISFHGRCGLWPIDDLQLYYMCLLFISFYSEVEVDPPIWALTIAAPVDSSLHHMVHLAEVIKANMEAYGKDGF